jgi:anti-anti-sigma factor
MLMTAIRTERPRGFRVAGEVDMSNEGVLSRLLAQEAAVDGDLTLELSGLAFIDSSGVRAILAAARRLAGRGRRLVLAGTRPAVRRVFDLMGVDRAPGVVYAEPGSALPGTRIRAQLSRRDADGGLHPVKRALCACGCPYLYAADDLALFWEPGQRFSPNCADRACQCHAAPLRG